MVSTCAIAGWKTGLVLALLCNTVTHSRPTRLHSAKMLDSASLDTAQGARAANAAARVYRAKGQSSSRVLAGIDPRGQQNGATGDLMTVRTHSAGLGRRRTQPRRRKHSRHNVVPRRLEIELSDLQARNLKPLSLVLCHEMLVGMIGTRYRENGCEWASSGHGVQMW